MGSQVCTCDRSDPNDDGVNLDLQNTVEVSLEPSGTAGLDTSVALTPDYFDSLQWADSGIAADSASLCNSWIEQFTDRENQDARKHTDECHDLIQPCIVETKGNQPAMNISAVSPEKRVLSTELSEGSTQPSEHNFSYSPNDGFQEPSSDIHISDQCECSNAIHAAHGDGDWKSNNDNLLQAEGGEAGSCQGHGLKCAPCPRPFAELFVQAEGVDVTSGSQAKLHHISAWYHVGATEDEDSDVADALRATGPPAACDAVRQRPASPKVDAVKISSRRPSNAKRSRAGTREEDVLLW